jgi:hypothetical protein
MTILKVSDNGFVRWAISGLCRVSPQRCVADLQLWRWDETWGGCGDQDDAMASPIARLRPCGSASTMTIS